MPIPQHAINQARTVQQQAATDPSARIRVIAGPGSGKSSCIEQRVLWLLNNGVLDTRIYAISFTRASARDLRERISQACAAQGVPCQARVSTMHSLALRVLRNAGLLNQYPVEPSVLDDWELENIFDAEFGVSSSITSKPRREAIRHYHEAFWSTGQWNPPNYIPPDPAITSSETNAFTTFHGPRTQTYACVLPGEIVRQCVQAINNAVIDPVQTLHIEHLIVDEYQDLNPMDQEFIDALIAQGANIFIGGDDDQSVYSFRFASPSGIQTFPARHPGTTLHTLDECFRCMPTVLMTATTLITNHASPQRVPKAMHSLYRHSAPVANGIVSRWRFLDGEQEARAIANSCRALIDAGVIPRDILILLNNKRALTTPLITAFQNAGVEFDSPDNDAFANVDTGRLVLAVLRIVGSPNDYIAHRTILGLLSGVGAGTTNTICELVINNNLNFRDIFYQPLIPNLFRGRALAALNRARAICGQISQWQSGETLQQRSNEITQIITDVLGPQAMPLWQGLAAPLPPDMNLEEVRDFVWAANDEQQAQVLETVYNRLNQVVPPTQAFQPRVRMMTMHGAKGLSAQIVFVPGLEEELIPGPWRSPYPGLILEAARLLYVSITRARAVCILSYAQRRLMHGEMRPHHLSRFAFHLAGVFSPRSQALDGGEVTQIVDECAKI